MNAELLNLLRCPETLQELRLATPQVVERLNARIQASQLKNRAGEVITETVEAGLIREDGKFLYPVRHGIPVMLVNESIPLDGQAS